MGAGDTIAGQLRVVRETQQGDQVIVAGPFSSDELDQANLDNRLFLNSTPGVDAPQGGANIQPAPNARFQPGEKLLLQHKASSLEEAVDYDADLVAMKCVERDLNTGAVKPRTLTVGDTALTSNPTSSSSSWVTVFQFNVPDRTRIALKGPQKWTAPENA